MNYLFYNWKFVLFDSPHLFNSLLPPISGNHKSVPCVYELVFVFLLRTFLNNPWANEKLKSEISKHFELNVD